jgi:O-antigen ligase
MESSTVAVEAPARERAAVVTATGAAITGGVALSVFWIAYDGGSFDVVSRLSLAVAVWWAIAVGVAVGVWPRARLARPALVAIGFLSAFMLWTLASAWWADSAEKAVLEATRVALYLGVYILAAIAGTRATAARWADGIAIGIVAIVVLALGQRFFPGLVELNELQRFADNHRLAYPLNYWNALAVFAALALPLLLRIAVASPNPLARAAAMAPFPAVASVLYLTSSRGGFLAAGVGVILFVLLSGRGWRAALASLLGAAGGAAAIATLMSTPGIAAPDSPGSTSAAVMVALACLACGLVFGAATAAAPADLRVPRPVTWAALALVAVLAVAGLARAEPRERFEQFKQPPTGASGDQGIRDHLLSTSGSNRWQVWTAAVDQFRTAPVVGQGGGSFEAWWLQHPQFVQVMRDAHSLYLETLGELGIVGMALLLVGLASALAASLRPVRGTQPRDRLLLAALAASVLAFLVAAGIDWFWESTAVAVAVFAALGLLARSNGRGSRRATWTRTVARLAAAGGALVVLLGCGVIFAAQLELQRSERAAAEGRPADATTAALRASALTPWSASPHLQLALLREEAGDVARAQASIGAALDRDPSDWTLWAVAARLHASRSAVADAREALARARELNPRAGILVQK